MPSPSPLLHMPARNAPQVANARTKVLVVTHYYPEHLGGMGIVAGVLAEALARASFEVRWASSAIEPSPARPGIKQLGFPALNLVERCTGITYPLWGPRSLWRLYRAVRAADVVHIHETLYLGSLAAFAFARWLGKPILFTQHTFGYAGWLQTLLKFFHRFVSHRLLRFADQVCFVSDSVCREFLSYGPFRRPPLVVPNGVDRQHFQPPSASERKKIRAQLGWAEDGLVVLYAGRFVANKGVGLLREAARRLPQLHFVFAGNGKLDPSSWRLPNVKCVGRLPARELARLYQAADVLALPAIGEGLPLVIQEALACQLPLVLSTEVVRCWRGLEAVSFVSERNAEALTGVLASLAASPALLDERRKRIAAFPLGDWDLDRSTRTYVQLLARLALKDSPSAPASADRRPIDKSAGR